MRDDAWLQQRLSQIWQFLFSEVERKNTVRIRFKGRWKNKFGHISRLKSQDTEIVINGLFRFEQVPEYLIDLTIAHELIHYMHGFHSPHPQVYRHPHQGGVVTKELRRRGFGHLLRKEKEFLRREWPDLQGRLSAASRTLRR